MRSRTESVVMTIHQFPTRVMRPCDTESMYQNAHSQSYVYTPTTTRATHLVRAVYWAQLFATALLAIAACLAVGAGFGALAIWMNTP